MRRGDFVWGAAAGALSAILFAFHLTGHAALGDATETIAGVSSLGILHAPGYPVYVLVAKLFTLLVPFGSEAFRVNLFSLVCSSLTIAGVALLGRRCGAARWAAAAAALCLAASPSFLFYSGFSKHDMFSGLLFVIAMHLVLAWIVQPSARRLTLLAAIIAAGLGSSWPLQVLILPTAGFALIAGRRHVTLRSLGAAAATGAVIVFAAYGFVAIRAAQNPAVNWGRATSFSRVAELVSRGDFTGSGRRPPARAPAGGASQSGAVSPPGAGAIALAPAAVSASTTGYGKSFVNELGAIGALLAAGGLLLSFRRRRAAAYPLLITFAVNLLGAAVAVGPGASPTLSTELVEGGFLFGCYFSLAAWMAIGATEVVNGAVGYLTRRRPAIDRRRRWLVLVGAAVMAGALVVQPVASSSNVTQRVSQPFADRYAKFVFGQLPRGSVIFLWGAELSQPLIYRQVVFHDRPDVVVVAADGLSYPWYRQEVSRKLGRPLPPLAGASAVDGARAVQSLVGVRPVYLDPQSVEFLRGQVGYRWQGLLAQATSDMKELPGSPPGQFQANVQAAERAVGLPAPAWDAWPNDYLETSTFSTVELAVAAHFYAAHDLHGMRQSLMNVLQIEPQNSAAARDLALLNSTSPAS